VSDYLLWVNDERTVLVRWWPDNQMEVATRTDPGAIWGPPINVKQEPIK
jgi:hypothetical protein